MSTLIVMKLPRTHRLLTTLVALFGMLFMQWAVASYACPGLQAGDGSGAARAAQTDMPPMPDCDQQQPDAARPALCHAHCHDGQASPDRAEAPAVFPAAVLVSTLLAAFEPLVEDSSPDAEPPSFLHRATAPPVSIRHCCLRL